MNKKVVKERARGKRKTAKPRGGMREYKGTERKIIE